MLADNVEMLKVRVFPDNRVDRVNAAIALGRSAKTLASWKCKGIGPRPVNVGGRVFMIGMKCGQWRGVRSL
ncbi:MAG: DNA-binding protein [Sphingomonadales bacterium]|nr:DNA-binding protein [Sphingomonadales bacterium]